MEFAQLIANEEYMKLAMEAAEKAGIHLRKREDVSVDAMTKHDIKLSSDRRSENVILDVLRPSGLPVLSEECGRIGDGDGLRWIVDPLDGTVNYFQNVDELSCVSIALWDGDKPLLGVINRFAAAEVFVGAAGKGAWLNAQKISTSGVTKAGEAVLATGFPSKRDYSDAALLAFIRQIQKVQKVRMLGTAALMAAFVACGRVDAYMEEDIMLWDIAAAAAIVQAAGGVVRYEKRPNENSCVFRCYATEELRQEMEKGDVKA